MELKSFIRFALEEDIGTGDHTSLATIPIKQVGKANLLVKEEGIAAGTDVAIEIFQTVDPSLSISTFIKDGDRISQGDIIFEVSGSTRSILTAERLVLNCMQRMSGIATTTRRYVDRIAGTGARVLDTRKTTPLMRTLEKQAVRIGGGFNHRYGLFDMILIKDNHVDSSGGIRQALEKARAYNEANNLRLPIEIETRNLDEIREALQTGIANRIMFDNFNPSLVSEAVKLVNRQAETEASGGITLDNIREYAEAGVDYISAGALTHSVKSLDLSLKIS